MENLSPCVVHPAKDTAPVTPLNSQGCVFDKELLINESQVTFYSTPATQSFASSCVGSRSVKETPRQSSRCIFDDDGKEVEKVVQHLSFTVCDTQQVDVTTENVLAEIKKESTGLIQTSSCNLQSFTVTNDDKGAGELPTTSNTIQAPSGSALCSPLCTDTAKETPCEDLESTFITSRGIGDAVPSQSPLNVTMALGANALVEVANVQPMQEHHDQGDQWLTSNNACQSLQEAQPLEHGDFCAKDTTFLEKHAEQEVPGSTERTTSTAEPAVADTDGSEGAEHHATVPGPTLGGMNDTFQMSEPMKGDPNTTIDGAQSRGVCNKTVNVESKENIRKAPAACSTVQNKQPSQRLPGAVRKAVPPSRMSLVPRAATQRRTAVGRPGPATAGQQGLCRQTTAQPLKATFDDKAGQAERLAGQAAGLSSRGKVPSRGTLVRQLRPPLRYSKPLQGNQPVVPSVRGASKGHPVREVQDSVATASAPAQGCNCEASRLKTASTRLQRPKITLGHSQIRKQPPTHPAQVKGNFASTPVRSGVPVIGHGELPTPIKKL
ncbi:uncharacterized protein LOC135400956 [Ornithodoros turicata]|uniref:uncharacterized protein LOC135400956 n=1 Tax=Ornithodoros turicata TaxID=34597 RepID=UPI003138B931